MLWDLIEDTILLVLFIALAPAIGVLWLARRGWEGVAWMRLQIAS